MLKFTKKIISGITWLTVYDFNFYLQAPLKFESDQANRALGK